VNHAKEKWYIGFSAASAMTQKNKFVARS